MARTFTGLKLQGSIGKFGNEELSDVSGYADLPDGKVECSMTLPCINCSITLYTINLLDRGARIGLFELSLAANKQPKTQPAA